MDGRRDVKFQSERMDGVTVIGTTERQLMVSSAQPETGRFMLPFEVVSVILLAALIGAIALARKERA